MHAAKAGPLRDRLAEIGERVKTGVSESWQVANRAQDISTALEQLDTRDARAKLAALEQDTSQPSGRSSESRSRTEESLRAQIASAERMSRLCPAAASACSVGVSVGRSLSPSAATPADTAPELTTTTSWPSTRSCATSPQSFSIAAVSMTPTSSVSDDVPTFATIVLIGRARSRS